MNLAKKSIHCRAVQGDVLKTRYRIDAWVRIPLNAKQLFPYSKSYFTY